MSSLRRKWSLAALALSASFGAIALAACSCGSSARPKPAHVVLIVIDTLRADHLGAFGYPRADNSPALDALAKQGVLFTNAISQCSWTSPSMISLMTSRYIARERVDIPSDVPTLAESFRRAGWRTGAFITNELLTEKNGFARGFEHFEPIAEYGSNEPVERWFHEVAGQKSFTYIHIKEPHDPYVRPDGEQRDRDRADLLPGDRAQFYERVESELQLHDNDANVAKIKAEIGGYDDDVRYADARVARFLDALQTNGMRATAAIAVTADHGEGLWERVALMNGQRGRKLREGEPPSLMNALMPTHGNQVSHELVHVPLILVAPGLPVAKVVAAPVENVDLFPTLLELADVAGPGGLQGESLLHRIDGERGAKDFAFSYTQFYASVITADGLQLVLPTPEGECAESLKVELYDLKADRYQRHDLAAEKPDVVARLSALAHERIKIAIHTAGTVSVEDQHALSALGYVDRAKQAALTLELAKMPLADVLARLATFNTPCLERLTIAESLVTRPIDDDSKAKLREWLAKETSSAVRKPIDELLAK